MFEIQAEDPAAKTASGAPKLIKCLLYVTTHDPFHEHSALNLEALETGANQDGVEKEATAKAVARPNQKPPLPTYHLQSAITLKLRSIAPIGTGPQRAEALRKLAASVNAHLQADTNWEVIPGKAKMATQLRRSEAGKRRTGGAWGQPDKAANKKADAVTIPIGLTRRTAYESPLPAQLRVVRPLNNMHLTLNGARDKNADFSIAGMAYYGNVKGHPGFYPKEVGKELVAEGFAPRTPKQKALFKALKEACEKHLEGEACIEALEKMVSQRGGVCHHKRECARQPCMAARLMADFSMAPISREANRLMEKHLTEGKQQQMQRAQQATLLAQRKFRLLKEQQAAADAELAEAQAKAEAAAKAERVGADDLNPNLGPNPNPISNPNPNPIPGP